jgi:conjugal transfer ATP-binding protein TraC
MVGSSRHVVFGDVTMLVTNRSPIPTQVSSGFVCLESYARANNLIISKPEGDGIYIGRCYEMSPLSGGGREFTNLVQTIYKSAPDDALLSTSLLSIPDYDVPYNLARGKTHGNRLVQELIQRQAQLYQDGLRVGALKDLPMINRKTVIMAFQTPVNLINDATLEQALAAQNEFLAGLKACGFVDVETRSPSELLAIYRQYANIYDRRRELPLDELMELRHQAFGPDEVFDFTGNDTVVFNKKLHCAAIVPKSLPSEINHGLANLLIGAPLNSGPTMEGGGLRVKTPFILNVTVRVANQRKELDRIEKAVKSRTRVDNRLPFSLGAEDAEEIASDLEYLQKTCMDGTNKLTYTSLTAFVFSRDKKELAQARTDFRTTLNNLHFDARDVTDTIGVRFAQVLPLNYSVKIAERLDSEALVPASVAAKLTPIFGDYRGNASGSPDRMGAVYVTRRGSAYYFDPFRTNKNKNGIIAASSGVGKSVKMQYMIKNELASGTRVTLFDNGRSSKKFCEAVNGDFIEFSLDAATQPSLNPFTGLTEDEFQEQAADITALILKAAYFNEPIEAGARIAVSEAVKAAYGKERGRADINTVIDALTNIKENVEESKSKTEVQMAAINLIPRLKNFVDSPSRGGYFLGDSNLATDNRFTVFELSGLDADEHLKQCVLFFVMNNLMRSLKKHSGRKLVMVDEAWQLLKDEGASAVMEGLYRKARKDGGSIWVITQSPRDLAGNATGEVILSQSVWKLIMEQEPEEIERVVAEGVMTRFANDPYFNRLIKDVRTQKGVCSEILICGENNYEVVRLYLDKFTGALFSTDGQERDTVFQLMRSGISAADAVNMVISDEQGKRSKWLKDIVSQLHGEGVTNDEIRRELEELLND